MRILCAAAMSIALGLFAACADDKKATEEARAGKLAALKKKYETELADLTSRLNKAEDPAAARGIQAEMRELAALTAEKVIAIATANPKDETGFAAAEFILQSAAKVGADGKDVETAVGLIAEHHAASPKVKELLIPAMRLGTPGEKLLKAVCEKGTDKDARGGGVLPARLSTFAATRRRGGREEAQGDGGRRQGTDREGRE